MTNVTIISDGSSMGTKVKVGDAFMGGIKKIEIMPIVVGSTVQARITVDVCSLNMAIKDTDIKCTDIETAAKIRHALLSYET